MEKSYNNTTTQVDFKIGKPDKKFKSSMHTRLLVKVSNRDSSSQCRSTMISLIDHKIYTKDNVATGAGCA